MPQVKGRGVWLGTTQDEQLKEIAWRRRSNKSEIIRMLLLEAATGSAKYLGTDSKPMTDRQVSFRMADDEWQATMKTLHASGTSVAEVVRRGVQALVEEEEL